jgi:hypothetical protein
VAIEDIVWDLVRLELLANEGARSFFVMGGKRKSLDALFANRAFAEGTTNRTRKPFLHHRSNTLHTIAIGPIDKKKLGILSPMFDKFPDLEFPSLIFTRRTAPFPENTKIDGYQVYVWEISSVGNRSTFLGRDMENRFSIEGT